MADSLDASFASRPQAEPRLRTLAAALEEAHRRVERGETVVLDPLVRDLDEGLAALTAAEGERLRPLLLNIVHGVQGLIAALERKAKDARSRMRDTTALRQATRAYQGQRP